MRKGSIPVGLIIAIVVILLVLFSAFGPFNLTKGFSDFFKDIAGVSKDEDKSVVYSGDVENIPVALSQEVSATRSGDIADKAVKCYLRMKNTDEDYHLCYVVSTPTKILLSDVETDISELSSETSEKTKFFLPKELDEFTGSFYVCADDDEVFLTYDKNRCHSSLSSDEPRSVKLSSDHDTAVRQLAGFLARCWFFADAYDNDVVCDIIDPSDLEHPVHKNWVKIFVAKYVPKDAVERLDDWWAHDNDARFPLEIKSDTGSFYSCCSDFGQWDHVDLCFTSDKNNDCCT